MPPPPVFFDTNILLYMVDGAAPTKRDVARRLFEDAVSSGNGVISFQVVQEWMNVALKRIAMPARDAELFLHRILVPLWKIQPSPDLYTMALSIHQETGWSWYDSMIVAAATSGKCAVLFSEDLQDGRTVRGVRITNPF